MISSSHVLYFHDFLCLVSHFSFFFLFFLVVVSLFLRNRLLFHDHRHDTTQWVRLLSAKKKEQNLNPHPRQQVGKRRKIAIQEARPAVPFYYSPLLVQLSTTADGYQQQSSSGRRSNDSSSSSSTTPSFYHLLHQEEQKGRSGGGKNCCESLTKKVPWRDEVLLGSSPLAAAGGSSMPSSSSLSKEDDHEEPTRNLSDTSSTAGHILTSKTRHLRCWGNIAHHDEDSNHDQHDDDEYCRDVISSLRWALSS